VPQGLRHIAAAAEFWHQWGAAASRNGHPLEVK